MCAAGSNLLLVPPLAPCHYTSHLASNGLQIKPYRMALKFEYNFYWRLHGRMYDSTWAEMTQRPTCVSRSFLPHKYRVIIIDIVRFRFWIRFRFQFVTIGFKSMRYNSIWPKCDVFFYCPSPCPTISLCWLIKTNRNEGKTWFLCFLFCFVRFCYLLFCFKHKNRYVKVYAMKLCHFPFSRGTFLRPKTFWHELSPSSSSSSPS